MPMLGRFRWHQTEHDRMPQLLQREQQPGEGVDDFVHAMQQLAARMKRPLSERQLIKIIKKGLRESIARFVYAMDVLTVDELRKECCEVERSTGRRGRATYTQPMRYSPAEKAKVSEAIGPDPGEDPPFRVGCWNCRAVDHGFRDCAATERRLFCYRCGKPDTVSPKCPDCAENGRLGDPRAERMRPDRSPAEKKSW
ncbi:uncharacterized protein LOC128263689 [Drosophila gunungcola]|uniref:uncharacterized protein LOC128263689 n=1 Tax=Drosophila gunungcola TaxID=103775 RepID=UPI0022DF4D9F|nr:uncharacterized protein LOC128263689 [Drosophila gunungcola]